MSNEHPEYERAEKEEKEKEEDDEEELKKLKPFTVSEAAEIAQRLGYKWATADPTESKEVKALLIGFFDRQVDRTRSFENHATILTRVSQAIVVAISVVSLVGVIDRLGQLQSGKVAGAAAAICYFSVTVGAVAIMELVLHRLRHAQWDARQQLVKALGTTILDKKAALDD
jgi:hypothetical protein